MPVLRRRLASNCCCRFAYFLPRNFRLTAAAGFVLLEVLILLSGNYNFFNLLTIVLCLALLDDRALGKQSSRPQSRTTASVKWRAVLLGMALLGALQIHATLSRADLPSWEIGVLTTVQPLQIVNRYGLFAVMTTQRDELVVEGSDDAKTWQELPFRFKPQRLDQAPRWVAPYQPRLDWQMWFAALTVPQGAPWFDNFAAQILLGSPQVAALLAPSPFGDRPPRYIRVRSYRYHFTSFAERRRSGDWWRRDLVGLWYPPARLSDPVSQSGRNAIPEDGK